MYRRLPLFVFAVVENTHWCPGVDQYFLTSHFLDFLGWRRLSSVNYSSRSTTTRIPVTYPPSIVT